MDKLCSLESNLEVSPWNEQKPGAGEENSYAKLENLANIKIMRKGNRGYLYFLTIYLQQKGFIKLQITKLKGTRYTFW